LACIEEEQAMNDQINLKRASILLVVATVIALVAHLVGLMLFNQHVYEVHGNDSEQASYLEIDARKDSTSTWVKRDYDLLGKPVDLTGATIDGTLHNASDDIIQNWTLRINVVHDCFINQAWNGEVEIHQSVGTAEEKVQHINLQDYKLEDVQLKNYYDGDLLIPLKAGDYVIYYPSEKFKEMPLAANDSVKIGVIFYYLDGIDLSDYDLTFQYHREFTQGFTFYVFMLLFILSLVLILSYAVSKATYKRAQTEMELRKSGMSSLSDMYAVIYIIDLVTGDMTVVSAVEEIERERPWRNGARALFEAISGNAEDAYSEVVRDFTNIDTLAQRLADRDSVVCEFPSKTYGWTSMRFFAMDRIEGRPIEKVVCTMQDINEEKLELDRVNRQISKAETESRAKNLFLANMSQEIQAPIHKMLNLGDRIAQESGEEQIRAYARRLHSSGDPLLLFVNGILDYADLEAGRVELAAGAYSLREFVLETVEETGFLFEDGRFAISLNVDAATPNGLRGDVLRLKQVVKSLLVTGAEAIGHGTLLLSIFSKKREGMAHLLVSVKAIGPGAEDETVLTTDGQHAWKVAENDGTSVGVGTSLVNALLSLMESELKVVQTSGALYECYFEVEQEIVQEAPVGSIELEQADKA
jgi:signal transduction histidine kinase